MNNEKYTKIGNALIVDKDNTKVVVKHKLENVNIKGLYTYLESRDFNYFPSLYDTSEKEDNYFEYLIDATMPKEQRAIDMINVVSLLHHKTGYFKEVREDKFKEVYENIESNILYLKDYNNNLFNKFFKDKYMSPSAYLFMRNYHKLNAALNFCEEELDSWYEIVKKEKKQRVSIVHNNLRIDHFIKGSKDALISWDKHKIDTPVLDLYNLYKNDYLNYPFSEVLNVYISRYPLLDHEQKLFFILINIPPKITFDFNEFDNTKDIRKKLDYIYVTEELTKPYYSKDEEE